MSRLLKKFFAYVGFVALILITSFYLLHPKNYFNISDDFETWNAKKIHSTMHFFRKWLDPSFRDYHYPTLRSNKSLDIIMPLVEKDLHTAENAIRAIRAHVFHPIGKIYIVAPESNKIRAFAEKENCEFVLEDSVVPNFEENRKLGGWFLQQFIKLNADNISASDNILIVDSDTVFLRNQVFIDDKSNTYTFNIHTDYAQHRKEFTSVILGTKDRYKLDFVAHHMIFNRQWLQDLKKEIEQIHKEEWHKVLYNYVKNDKSQGLSEYDIYATYVCFRHPKNVRFLASANVVVYRDRYDYLDLYRSTYAQDYKSVSSHSFMKLAS